MVTPQPRLAHELSTPFFFLAFTALLLLTVPPLYNNTLRTVRSPTHSTTITHLAHYVKTLDEQREPAEAELTAAAAAADPLYKFTTTIVIIIVSFCFTSLFCCAAVIIVVVVVIVIVIVSITLFVHVDKTRCRNPQ